MKELPFKTAVLGFDVRSLLDDSGFTGWTDERRSRFLIKPDVQWPVSVDRIVWPSIVEEETQSSCEHPLKLWRSIRQLLKVCSGISLADVAGPVAVEISVVSGQRCLRYFEGVMEGLIEREGADYGTTVAIEPSAMTWRTPTS